MTLPLIDIVPRMQRMVSRPEAIPPVMMIAALCGLVEGLALAAMQTPTTSGQPAYS